MPRYGMNNETCEVLNAISQGENDAYAASRLLY